MTDAKPSAWARLLLAAVAALVWWGWEDTRARLDAIDGTLRAVEIRQAEAAAAGSNVRELDELRARVEELERGVRLNTAKANHLHQLLKKERTQ